MTTTELLVVLGAGALGYWIVAVLWPHVRGGGAHRGDTASRSGPQTAAMWYHELDLPRDADRDAIDAAYRAKLAEYHPDRLAGLPAEAREQARIRVIRLEQAHDAAVRELEWMRPPQP